MKIIRSMKLCLMASVVVLALASCSSGGKPPLPENPEDSVMGETEAEAAGAREVVDPRKMSFAELVYDVPEPERVEMANGMVVYLYEDRLLPIVSIYSVIHTGQVYEPAEKAGLAALTGSVMRTGGTEKMSSREVDEKLEFIAARCGTNIFRDGGTASLTVLSKDLDEALPVFADILRRPAFEQARIDLQKQQLIEQFRRENDDPFSILGREFRRLTYGSHPYSRRLSGYPETLEKITRKDLVGFHEKYYHPNNMILGVAGDFSRDEMIEKLQKYFGDWKNVETKYPEVPEMEYDPKKQLAFVPKDLTQSNIFIGHVGVDRLNPDYFSIMLMNYILGASGFNSRLMENVRTKSGLAYSVGSFMQYSKYPGMFICYCSTKSESSHDAAKKILDELRRIRDKEVTDEEFKRARDAIRNQFVFKFDQSYEIVIRYLNLEYEGLPRDYLQNYLKNVDAVTKKDILNAAKKYIHPEKSTVLVLGKEEALEVFPKDFGEFEVIALEE